MSLLQSIANPQYLKKCWNKLNKSNKNSHGLSQDTIEEFGNTIDVQIKEISKQLLNHKYKFNSVRAVVIPKKETGKFRPLRIGDVRDRLVQKALSTKLEELLSKTYKLDNPCSYAYQKDRGIEDAIHKLIEHYKNGNKFILEADIIKFFDKVNRQKLLQKVFSDLKDATINALIEDALNQSVGDLDNLSHEYHHYFLDSVDGIPQGNSLSPLLANIYLSDFDQKMINEGFCLVRYADDFVVLCKSTVEAKRALKIAKIELEDKLDLKLHALASPIHSNTSKTRIIDPVFHAFSFLSIRFDGKNVWVSEDKVKGLIEKIKGFTTLSFYNNDADFKGLFTVIKRTKNVLEGWLASYKFVDIERDFKKIDDVINHRLCEVFINLDFKLRSSSLNNVKLQGKSEMVQALNKTQRSNTGVPTCEDFLKKLKRNKITL